MLAPWLELDGAAARVAAWSQATGLDLARLGTTADADEIADTAVTQPLLVTAALLSYEQLIARVPAPAAGVVAGHSVGELAAAALAGALRADDAVALAAVRGAEMAKACALTPTGMAAVLGGEADEVLAMIAEAGLVAANRNGAGQVVAAGPKDALAGLADRAPLGVKVRLLAVAGAFHTDFMAPAGEALGLRVASVPVADEPRLPMLSNADGEPVAASGLLARLVAQVTLPVRWDACMDTLGRLGVTGAIEFAPAGTLTNLLKRAQPGIARMPLRGPGDLDAAAAFLAEHTAAAHESDGDSDSNPGSAA